jgi:hypothetical protein
MTRILLLAAAAALCVTATVFAQDTSIVIQNQEDTPFHYVVDPAELSGLTAGSPLLASKVAGYFSTPDPGTSFSLLPPQGQARLTDLAPGSHLLVGFFEVTDSESFPVRVMAIQADPTTPDRFYSIFAGAAQLTAHRGVGKLAPFAASGQTAAAASGTGTAGTSDTGGAAAASGTTAAAGTSGSQAASTAGSATALPVLAAFSATYDPVVFTRETRGDFKVLPIAQARSWSQTGTRIASVEGALDFSGLRLVITVPEGFSPSVSYFLYVFDSRAAGRDNSITLEIQPLARGTRGACILWQKGSTPRLLGSVKTGATSVELDAGSNELSGGLLASAGASPTVDLTAGWYDKALGLWEEFYYTTISATR